MANIYKRQPIQHKLPTGWSDLDNIRNNTLGTIKGLYHVDNPMTSDQNATYNCKNVYQDESGNLTVRPSLRYIAAPSKGTMKIYNTVKGKIEYIKADNTFYLKFKGITDKVYTDGGRVTIEESDGNVYIFYTNAAGYLGFKVWNDSGVVNIDPDILPNSSDSPMPSRYNLLSDKTKAEIMPTMRTEDMWLTTDSAEIDGHSVYITKHSDIIITRKLNPTPYERYLEVRTFIKVGNFYEEAEVQRLVDTAYNSDGSTFTVVPNIIDDTDNGYIILSYVAALINDEYVIPRRVDITINIYTGSAVYNETLLPERGNKIYLTYPCYNNVTLFAINSEDNMVIGFIAHNGSEYVSLTDGSFSYTDLENVAIKLGSSNNSVVMWCYTENDTIISGNYKVVCLEYSIPDLTLKHIPTVLYTSVMGTIVSSYDYVFTKYGEKVYYVRDMSNFDAVSHKLSGKYISVDANSDVTAIGSSLISYKNFKVSVINVSGESSEYVFNEDDNIGLIFTNIDGTSVVKIYNNLSAVILARVKTPVYREFKREVTDDFPVLSEIKDEILTSFYLDSIYWFVTKHRIFGTGVANEKFLITYFDPRKYFHFTEELTGAVRISDTSFWVFHNNGAYLIYKSASSVYDETIEDYVEVVTWLVTNTAKSKGCDFDNAIVTLPINNYIACVTADDISIVQMRENVQTDDRILVPITLSLSKFVSGLLNETRDIVTGTYRYNSIFFLNPVNKIGKVPTLVYNVATESWWYWELPVNEVLQATMTETNLEILAEYDGNCRVYDLFTEYYNHTIGGLTYQIYADRLTSKIPTQIEWFWESAILHFGTADYRKQLLSTSFTLGERESSEVTFDYNFEVYADKYSERTWTQVDKVIERARSFSYKNIIANFAYLQLYIKNREPEENVFESYTRPKFSTISFKYRILPGGHL